MTSDQLLRLDCSVDMFSSRVCERGTKSCTVEHDTPPCGEDGHVLCGECFHLHRERAHPEALGAIRKRAIRRAWWRGFWHGLFFIRKGDS